MSGVSKGCGSSRETAPYSELARRASSIVIARSIEKIYGQNAQNIGLLTSTDFGSSSASKRGEDIPIGEFTRGLDPISAGDRRARRALRLQPRAPGGRGVAADHHDAGAAR